MNRSNGRSIVKSTEKSTEKSELKSRVIKGNSASSPKILLFKTGALGDVLMTTPLVRQLRKKFRKSKIDYLIGKSSSQILEGNKYLDEIIEFDEKLFFKKNPAEWFRLISRIRARRYDMIFVLDKHWVFNLTSYLFGIKKRIGFNRGMEGLFLNYSADYGRKRHEVFYYLDLLNSISKANYKDTEMDLFISKKDKTLANKFLKKNNIQSFCVIANSGGNNPGEKSKVRKIPEKLFSSIVKDISKKYSIIFIGSRNEQDYYEDYKDFCSNDNNCHNLAGKLTLKETAALMKKAEFILTSDSGPMHLGASVNKKVISIFGPTNPERKAPLSKESRAIWKDQKIYDENYELYGNIPRKEYMKKIKAEDVLKIIY